MAQPDISSILAALAQGGTPQAPTPTQQGPPGHAPPPGYPPGLPQQPPSAPPQSSYLPQPSNTGSVDLSSIKPVNSGSVSIADAIAKAKSIAANRGVQSYDPRQSSSTPREDPRLAARDFGRSRSRSPARHDSYGGNPYRDERREDPRRGSYRRSPSQDRNFRGSRDPPPGYRSDDGQTETIRVKSSLVGLIIGRGGENLKRIETDSGAKVQFVQAKEPHATERQCTISGSLRAREAAKAAIFGIIDENGGQNVMQEKGAYTPGMPGRAKVNLPAHREDDNQTQIMVPDKTVGLIIGRGGETIKDLQERSGCHVNIVGENKSVNGLRPVNLIGDDRQTQVAKALIMEIVESDLKSSGANQAAPQRDRGYDNYNQRGGGGGGGVGGRDWIEKTIKVPSEAVGMIIGKGGETIKDLQKTTGCKINVNQPKPPDVTRDIDLAGNSRAMAEAESTIWEKVDVVRQRDEAAGRGGRGGGGGGGGSYDRYSQQQQQPQVPAYGQYMPPQQTQAPPQMPPFQMPGQQSTPQPGDPHASDPYAAWGGQQAVYQWYAQQMANLGQQPPPGTQ
ncbi:uncharacterized protein LTR77_000357 [Saxophila tyrrhenica]|uniref:K Homology domain-containing protein n=1 Tax=Saxophila tyrrhenica TaxID=1690608 RepID=A0AAV9PSA5_9PEZI|nr:hypothetical protein LTR77_000357 [Saxophila tyrrhenica]